MSEGRVTRILLIDDHPIVREGIRRLVERHPELEVVGEASSLGEALEFSTDHDVIVADLMLGDARGAEVVSALKERFPSSEILVLTMLDNSSDVQMCLNAGARGYLLKESAADDLVEAIRRVARSEDYLHPALGAAIARLVSVPINWNTGRGELSLREIEILKLLGLGHTNAEVAKMLGVSPRTIEAHRSHIMGKLGVDSRAGLVKAAVERGLLDDHGDENEASD